MVIRGPLTSKNPIPPRFVKILEDFCFATDGALQDGMAENGSPALLLHWRPLFTIWSNLTEEGQRATQLDCQEPAAPTGTSQDDELGISCLDDKDRT